MDGFRIKILVKCAYEIKRSVIEDKPAFARFKFSESEAHAFAIGDGALQMNFKSIEIRFVWTPEAHVLYRAAERLFSGYYGRNAVFKYQPMAAVIHAEMNGGLFADRRIGKPLSGKLNVNAEVAAHVRRYMDLLYVNRRAKLYTNALPDTAILQIPILLAMGDFVVHHLRAKGLVKLLIHRWINHPHRELVHARFYDVSDIQRERRIAAFMRSC